MPQLRDIAGRLFSRLRGTAARNRYASVVRQKVQTFREQQGREQARQQERIDRELGKLQREREIGTMFSDFRRQLKRDLADKAAEATAAIGAFTPPPDVGLGVDHGPENWSAEWIPVQSSNVAAVRWVGGNWGTQVRFLNGYEYEYYTSYAEFEGLLHAPSKGKHIWFWRYARKPYHRLSGGGGPTTLRYPWGRRVGGVNNRELLRNPNFPRRKLR